MSFFSQNHTEITSDDWTITKKTTRTIKHENLSKMKNLKVDRWALSLSESTGTATMPCIILYISASLKSLLRSSNCCQPSSFRILVTLVKVLWSPLTKRAARRWIFSIDEMSEDRWGSHIVAAYSSVERTRDIYAVSFKDGALPEVPA